MHISTISSLMKHPIFFVLQVRTNSVERLSGHKGTSSVAVIDVVEVMLIRGMMVTKGAFRRARPPRVD